MAQPEGLEVLRQILATVQSIERKMGGRTTRSRAAAKPKLPASVTQFLAGVHSHWLAQIGACDMGRFIKALQSLAPRGEWGEGDLQDWCNAITLYRCEMMAQPSARRGFYASVEAFAKQAAEFLRVAKMPYQDEQGNPTRRHHLLTLPESPL